MQALYNCLFNPFPSSTPPPPPSSFIFWLSFHFSLGQNRKSPSSVFLRSETKRKRLLRRLLFSFLSRLSYPFSRFPFLLPRSKVTWVWCLPKGWEERRLLRAIGQRSCLSFRFSLCLFPSPQKHMILSLAQRNLPAMEAILGQNWKILMTISEECFVVQMLNT